MTGWRGWRTEGATNSGAVDFQDAGGKKTQVSLTLEYQPEGIVEKVGDLLHVVGRQAEQDLKKFKEFIEHAGHATGAWRKPVPGSESTAGGTPAAGTEFNRFEHPFDQTGGLVDFEGESDETAEGENYSSGERRAHHRDEGYIPPISGTLGPR